MQRETARVYAACAKKALNSRIVDNHQVLIDKVDTIKLSSDARV